MATRFTHWATRTHTRTHASLFAHFEGGRRSRFGGRLALLGAEGHDAFDAARGLALPVEERDRVEVELDGHVEQRQHQLRAADQVVRTELIRIVHLNPEGLAALDEVELAVRPAEGLPLRIAIPLDHLALGQLDVVDRVLLENLIRVRFRVGVGVRVLTLS